MSDFETKTDYLLETKGLLKDRINSLGGSITSGTTFRDYLVWLDSLYEALEEKTITGLPDSLEGKCEQNTTPSKNLYNANDTTYYGSCTYVSGVNTNQYKVKATGTDVIINSQVASGSSYSSGAGTLIPCKYGETIYYDTGNSNFSKNFITQYNSSKVSLGFANTGSSSGSYTPTNSACEYISIRIGYGSATNGTEYTLAPIISKSSDLSYEPYTGPVPNPNNPRPINITTGRQVVSVVGKNLFDSVFRQGNRIDLTNASRVFADSNYYLEQGKTYTFSTDMDTNVYRFAINISSTPFPSNTTTYDSGWKTQASFTFTASVNGYLGIIVSRVNDAHFTPSEISNIKWQLEKGSQATTYEEYKGNDYEINLGKNILDLSGFVTHTNYGGLNISYSNGKLLIDGTATSNVDMYLLNTGWNTKGQELSNIINSQISYLTLSSTKSGLIYYFQMNGAYIQNTINRANPTDNVTNMFVRIPNGTSFNNEEIGIQLERGNSASSFAPYKTPIYLGKIGTYQDYIFRNTTENPLYNSNLEEGQWYIHKEIGRVVLNGTQNITLAGSGVRRFNANYTTLGITNVKEGTSNLDTAQYRLNDHFVYNTTSTNFGNYYLYNNWLVLFDANNTIADANTLKTWFSNNNTNIYYVLNTPTNTLIEDEELINQLNEIEIFTVISEDFYN